MAKTTNNKEHSLPEVPAINPAIPSRLAKRLLLLPDKSRSMGVHICAGRGSGKSRLMGRVIGWMDFIRGVPLIILDPNGPTIDNLLDKITRLPKREQQRLWKRILYVDMAGRGHRIVPFPLYYRLGDETLYEMSQRYLDTIRKTDPNLLSASIQGWNALSRVGTHAGMALSALGYQITEAADLIRNPETWQRHFAKAQIQYPDVQPAIDFFTSQYASWNERERAMQTDSFLNKVALFQLDPSLQTMFGADTPGINWPDVITKRQAVLLDFRHVYDLELRRFKMLWAFTYFLDFVKHRGAGRHQPISLIIDELTALYNFQGTISSPFASDIDELINVIARNYRVWLTICHQELYQLDERTQKTLMSMGTQILGTTSDPEAALRLARYFFRIDPYKVRRYEPVYASIEGMPEQIDSRPVEYTIEQQQYLASYEIRDQGLFQFLVRVAGAEGDVRSRTIPMTIRNFDKNQWVNDALVEKVRDLLRERTGVIKEEILTAIAKRLNEPKPESATSQKPTATMTLHAHNLPQAPTPDDDDESDEAFRETKTTAAANTQHGC